MLGPRANALACLLAAGARGLAGKARGARAAKDVVEEARARRGCVRCAQGSAR
jgi:hypothetical protein